MNKASCATLSHEEIEALVGKLVRLSWPHGRSDSYQSHRVGVVTEVVRKEDYYYKGRIKLSVKNHLSAVDIYYGGTPGSAMNISITTAEEAT